MFYIDESGSIPSFHDTRRKNRFFVIGFAHTDDPKKVNRTYKKAIGDLKKSFPAFFASLSDPNELKGSDAPPFMKQYIFEKLLLKTDIRIGHIVVDTTQIREQFRSMPSRTFNFLVKLMIQNFPLSQVDRQCLRLCIDNRNTANKSLRTLEEYLYNELVLGDGIVNDVKVEYCESKNNRNIQVADMFTNAIYQKFRFHGLPTPSLEKIKQGHGFLTETNEVIYGQLFSRIAVPFVYPPYTAEAYQQVAAYKSL